MRQFKSILVHVDSRDEKHSQLECGIQLASRHGASLKIVDVVPDLSWPIRLLAGEHDEIRNMVTAQKVTTLDALVSDAGRRGLASVEGKVLHGRSSAAILEEVKHAGHDLVIQNAKGSASRQPGLFGATASRLMRTLPCTVWLYRIPRSNVGQRVVAAVDATTEDPNHARLNQEILEVAAGIATGEPPHVLHVWSVYAESMVKDYFKKDEFQALVEDAQQAARKKLNELLREVSPRSNESNVHLLHGHEADEITNLVNTEHFDVLVIGTVGRSGVSGFLIGNTAEAVLDRVPCSVVAVKPAEFAARTSSSS